MNLYRSFLCLLFFFLIYAFNVGAVNASSNEIKIGEYEIMTPKVGFRGAPPSPAARASMLTPTKPSHFNKRYVRIAKIAEREQADLRRIVFRIDEIDDNGNMVKQDLYFLYIDISPEGVQIIPKNEDDGSIRDDSGIRKYGMPFPFTCVRSPVLGFKDGEADGYLTHSGQGVEFVRKKAKETDKSIQIEAVYFDTGEGGKTRWYGNEIDRIRKEKSSVKFREKQEWENENDWLWTKMERYDASGNIMMHCRKIKIGSIDKENDWPINLRMTNVNDWATSQNSTNGLTK